MFFSKIIIKIVSEKNHNSSSKDMDLTESLIASEYSVIRKIGEGRFSEVYLVTNIKDQKLYALKFHNLEQVKDKNERE
jgi:serine/threonine protein kinase